MTILELRDQAVTYQQQAGQAKDAAVRDSFLLLAEIYDAEADALETPKSPEKSK